MCDSKQISDPQPQVETGQGVNSYGMLYVPDGRTDIEDCIKMLRNKADQLQALLDALPKAISNDAKHMLQYLASQIWRMS